MREFRFILVTLFGLGLAGSICAEEGIPDAKAKRYDVADVKPADPWKQRYELGPGDVLNFRLHGMPELNKSGVAVAPDGTVSYLQARRISVVGLTISEGKTKVETELAKYYRSPKLILTPVALGSKRYTVLGEKAGTFALDRPISLLEGLASSGGVAVGGRLDEGSSRVDFESSLIVRSGKILNVDLGDLYLRGDLSQNIQIEAGDYIYLAPQEINECYVFGAVGRPGVIPFRDNMTALGAIAAASGYAPQAWKKKILVVKGNLATPETKVIDTKLVFEGRNTSTLLERGDIVYVNTKPWALAEDLLQVAIRSFIRGVAVGLADEAAVSVGFDSNRNTP